MRRPIPAVQKGRCAKCYDDLIEVQRELRYLRMYGIDMNDYNQILAKQGGVCAACKMPETTKHPTSRRKLPLCIDHNHTTGRVRGLLCSTCNRAMGILEDDPRRIAGLLNYAAAQEEEDRKNIPVVKKKGPGPKVGETIDYDLALKNLEKYLGIEKPFDFTFVPRPKNRASKAVADK